MSRFETFAVMGVVVLALIVLAIQRKDRDKAKPGDASKIISGHKVIRRPWPEPLVGDGLRILERDNDPSGVQAVPLTVVDAAAVDGALSEQKGPLELDPNELADRLRKLRTQFGELRGRL